jgi:hypothetical protein
VEQRLECQQEIEIELIETHFTKRNADELYPHYKILAGEDPNRGSSAKNTRLILLGTQGGPGFKGNRAQSANLLVVGNTPYLAWGFAFMGLGMVLSLVLLACVFPYERSIRRKKRQRSALHHSR